MGAGHAGPARKLPGPTNRDLDPFRLQGPDHFRVALSDVKADLFHPFYS